MKRALREQIKAIRSEAEAMGVSVRGWAHGSKHPFVALDCEGDTLRVFMASSPSGGLENTLDKCRRKTRRMIEQSRRQA